MAARDETGDGGLDDGRLARPRALLGDASASVWALLWQTAPTDADRIAVRCGTLDREVFRDAVATIQRQAAA